MRKIFVLLAISLVCASSLAARSIYAYTGDERLEIALVDNSSADALVDYLKGGDVTVAMHDYGGFEKVGELGATLPKNDERITTVPGDVILYLGRRIVIYYDENTWSFTRLGKVKGLGGKDLRRILGKGDVTVRFSLD